MSEMMVGADDNELWDLKKKRERTVIKYGVSEHDYTFHPSTQPIDSYEGGSLEDNIQHLTTSLEALVPTVLREAQLPPNAYAAITLHSKQLNHPIRISWLHVKEMTRDIINATFEHVMQSLNEFLLDDDVLVNVVATEGWRGGGQVRRKLTSTTLNVEENLKKDKNLVVPPTAVNDQMCFAQCLVFGMAHRL